MRTEMTVRYEQSENFSWPWQRVELKTRGILLRFFYRIMGRLWA